MKFIKETLLVSATLSLTSTAFGAVTVLTFEGLKDLEPVLEFYNGGQGGGGSGPGPNYGIQFNADALAVIDSDAGGSGNFGGEPSPSTAVAFLTGSAVMNIAAGFETGFSFFYSAIQVPGVVKVYDDLNATGTLLATIQLPLTPINGAPDPTGDFSPLVPTGVAFAGIAKSVDFGGAFNGIGFDNITFGASDPVIPEASTVFSVIGLGALAGSTWCRARRSSRS